MATASVKDRFCFIINDDNPIYLQISADEAIVCGGDFKLMDKTRQSTIDNWKMSIQRGQKQRKYIRLAAKDLHQCYLFWQVLFCSSNSNVHSGKIELQVIQNEEPCHLTIPALWKVYDVPPCQINAPDTFNGSLTFLIKPNATKFII